MIIVTFWFRYPLSNTSKSESLNGQWTGFLNSRSEPRMAVDILLKFVDERITGVGNDENGMFVLSGDYDVAEQECRWVQTYLFGDTIFYRGICEPDRIWGTWTAADERHGGFEIRPTEIRKAELSNPHTGSMDPSYL